MACFYGESALADMASLPADDLVFKGPLHESRSVAYLAALSADPPRDSRYQILHRYQNADSAGLVYRFS